MKVLIVVDMQKGFMKNKKYDNLSFKINELVQSCQYDKLIYTKFKNDQSVNSLFIDRLGWTGMTTPNEQEFSIVVPDGVICFEKNGYGLKQEDLIYIKSFGVSEVDICGVTSDACVYAIALQLWDLGIYPNILKDFVLGEIDMSSIFKTQFGVE